MFNSRDRSVNIFLDYNYINLSPIFGYYLYLLTYKISLSSPKVEKFESMLLHSVLGGGGGIKSGSGGLVRVGRTGLDILISSPGLYQFPKLRYLNFCCCTVCFGGWVGGGGMRGLVGPPGLYQVPKLRYLNFCCCTVCFFGGGGGPGG